MSAGFLRAGAALAALALVAPGQGLAQTGEAARGAVVYQRCMSCHSPDANRFGPMHRGVFGRVAGTVAGYNYTPGLKAAGFTWDDAHLQTWLTNPGAMIPGTRMTFKLSDPRDRADVIAFLKTLR